MGIFWVLQRLVHMDQDGIARRDDIRVVDFVRLRHESEPQKKERVKPEKPKPMPPEPQPKVQVQQPQLPHKAMAAEPMALDLAPAVDLSAGGMPGDAVIAGGGIGREFEINLNVIPLSRVQPVYPRRAKMMKVEGYVQAEFTITASGRVKDVVIVKSQPEGVFDSAAERALIHWTFKPKIVQGEAVPQRAGLTVSFRLDP